MQNILLNLLTLSLMLSCASNKRATHKILDNLSINQIIYNDHIKHQIIEKSINTKYYFSVNELLKIKKLKEELFSEINIIKLMSSSNIFYSIDGVSNIDPTLVKGYIWNTQFVLEYHNFETKGNKRMLSYQIEKISRFNDIDIDWQILKSDIEKFNREYILEKSINSEVDHGYKLIATISSIKEKYPTLKKAIIFQEY